MTYPPEHPWSGLPVEQQKYLKMQDECRDEIAAQRPDLPFLTVVVMGGDLASMRFWRNRFDAGETSAQEAITMTGSFYRWEQAVRMLREGHVTNEWFLERVCSLWRGADPDDTDAENLFIWRRMVRVNGGAYLRDDRALPKGRVLTVYRGGAPYEPGIAWTTDPKIAAKFAGGAGLRVKATGGTIVRGEVNRRDVLAYITGRGESEVIVNPALVRIEGGDQ